MIIDYLLDSIRFDAPSFPAFPSSVSPHGGKAGSAVIKIRTTTVDRLIHHASGVAEGGGLEVEAGIAVVSEAR